MKKFTALLALTLGVMSVNVQAESLKPAYYVAEFQPIDREGMRPYSAKVEETFKPFGGRFLVRGGVMEMKEGMGSQGPLVIIQFDSLEKAQAWFNSPAYQEIIPIRQRSGNTRSYIVEGLAK